MTPNVGKAFGVTSGCPSLGAVGDEFVEVFEGGGGGFHVGWGQNGGVGEAAAGPVYRSRFIGPALVFRGLDEKTSLS